jgi:diguanylate cyclase (GGDEF)-like protein/PAS domain S-box-containing protein
LNPTGARDERPRILVADDEETSRMVLRQALELAGFAVEEAVNGAEAVEKFARLSPELVILDVVMPGMDGFEATAAIRRRPGGDALPILILTSLDDIASVKRAYETGATDFASKPIHPLVLGHRVRYMLRAKRAFDDLRESEARLAAAQQIARLGNWERDLTTGAMKWSAEMYRLYGVAHEAFTPTWDTVQERIHPEDRDLVHRATQEAVRGERPYSVDLRIGGEGRSERFVHEQAVVVRDASGGPLRLAGTTQDITDRKEVESQLRFLAYYDGLTRLPNRVLFLERLNLALRAADRKGQVVALLFLDLDRFKDINDTFGHSVGDRLLSIVAERLRKCLRSSDTLARGDPLASRDTVARLGGDEFTVSITDVVRVEDAARIARRMLESLEEPIRLDEHELFVTGSVGISVFPHDGLDAETLLKNADSAMYHAKEAGRNQYQFYNPTMSASALRRLSLENSLRRAIERDELVLHFQPLVDADTERIFGAEALVRWKHPELGMVPPADFIPLAEETGLILPIEEWVLRHACREAKAWQVEGAPALKISINLSARQFRERRLIDNMKRVLHEAGLDPRCVELEITESALMRHTEEAIGTIRGLKSLGLRIALDDFGTGYSSLSYLTRFPIDTLKIDRLFVKDIVSDTAGAAITAAIISMATGLRMEVIAEGVETREQLAELRKRGCRLMQGYLFGRPVPAADFRRLLEHQAAGRRLLAPVG